MGLVPQLEFQSWPLFGEKKLLIWLNMYSVRSLCVLFVILVVSHFVFEGGTLGFSAPGPKSLSFAFEKCSILAAI